MPSEELTAYLTARATGASVESACLTSGIDLTEAELHEADIASGELELPHVHVHACEGEEEASMEDVTTTIRVNDGPEIPINLHDIDAPENAGAKAALEEFVGDALKNNGNVAGERLRLFMERVERLDEEIKALNEDKSDVFKEMKDSGFDTKTVKRILKLRKMQPHERQEAEALLQTYMNSLGMTPIEEAIALAAAA